MKTCAVACLVLLLAHLLSGCSRSLQVMLFNNTDGTVSVRTYRRIIAIEPKHFAKFFYNDARDPWRLHLMAAGREHVYDLPHSLEHAPRAGGTPVPLKAQLESNFQIYLLPATAAAAGDVASLGSLQRHGFPLHPHLQE